MRLLMIALLYSIRPVDPLAVETLDLALDRSPLVRSLIDTLERSNVIVHITTARDMPSGICGTTRFVVSRGGHRYVRITIDASVTQTARAAILGHELQHAVELALSDADDHASVRRLFEGRGDSSGRYFETRAAIQVERAVRRELVALQAQPVVKFDH